MKSPNLQSPPTDSSPTLPRREFLQFLGAGALGLALAARGARAQADSGSRTLGRQGPKQWAGVFPIAETPFTPDDKLDLESLAGQVTFCNRGGVHGLMWPQIASAWTTLKEDERLAGAEAMLAAGKGGNASLVIGIQGPDMAAVTRYAKHAAKLGADALISLPPAKVTDEKALLAYYQEVGGLTDLPIFVQCTGTMSVDLVVEMFKTIPTMRHVKDEAGVPVERIAELRKRTDDQLKVFSGQGVRTMITEMELGFSGHCPYTGLGDIYAAAYDLWHAGQRPEGFAMFGRILAFGSLGTVDQNRLLIDRGVFKSTARFRTAAGGGGGGGGGGAGGRGGLALNDAGARAAIDNYLKPYLKA